MKALRHFHFLLGLLLLVQPLLHAQNPYERLGVKSDPLTLSQGRYQEFFPNDTLVQIGSVIFNTITQEVVGFVEPDSSGLDFPADVASRWLSPDPLAHMFPEWNPYNYTFNNPVYWTDPDGRCPICPLLVKGGAAAAADALLQMTFAYAFDDNVNTFSQAAGQIDASDVMLSGLEGMLPWKAPGGKYGKAAITATADVMLSAGEAQLSGQEYGWEQAGQDFLIGFIAQLGAEQAGEFMQSKKVQALLGMTSTPFSGAKGLIGFDYENFLVSKLDNASGSFKVGGREFDGRFGESGLSWFEAKSGRYWQDIASTEKGLARFKSNMGQRMQLAKEAGASFELFSNTPIPQDIKSWLDKKGIKYTETLD